VDENVRRMILFHLNASFILGFYMDFPKPWYKNKKIQKNPHTLQSYFNLGFAMPLEFGTSEITSVCKTLVIAV